MNWADMTPKERTRIVREKVQAEGWTYAQVAAKYGTTRTAVAGIVNRAKTAGEPIENSNGLAFGRARIARKPKNGGATATIQQKARNARTAVKPHAGLTAYVSLGEPEPAVSLKPGAWNALPGSTPVPLDLRTGCAWPLGDGHPFLFCDLPVEEGKSWCPVHYAMGNRPVVVGTSARSKTKQERTKL